MSNFKHYPTHPGAEHPPTMTCEIPLEEYESIKRENERLNRELEHVKNGDCIYTCDVVEKHVKEELKAKRALWLARAERAASWQIHFSLCHNHSIEREFSINGASMPCEGIVTMRTARDWSMIWKKVERKCRAKAEEYK